MLLCVLLALGEMPTSTVISRNFHEFYFIHPQSGNGYSDTYLLSTSSEPAVIRCQRDSSGQRDSAQAPSFFPEHCHEVPII